jgi:hypothetical protein
VVQLVNSLRCLGIYMLSISLIYLVGSFLQYYYLSIESFDSMKEKESWSDEYVAEMFSYSKEIEEVKVLHAIGMAIICGIICGMVVKKKLLTKRQYSNLLLMTCLITMLYFFPVLAIGYKTYNLRGPDAERSAKILADWLYILMKNNDTNVVGLGFSMVVHGQIYAILFGLQWLTYTVRNTIRRLESLRDSSRSDYDTEALKQIYEMTEDGMRPKGMLDTGVELKSKKQPL